MANQVQGCTDRRFCFHDRPWYRKEVDHQKNNSMHSSVIENTQDLSEQRSKKPLWSLNTGNLCDGSLPEYDKALDMRKICIAGLVLSWLASLACIGAAAYAFSRHAAIRYHFSLALAEILPLLFNIFITLCIDCLSYIHTTSLRWALWREKRLVFNSNLCLFSSARHCAANHWATNAVSAFCLVVSYTGTSQLFINGAINSLALIALGIGLFGQAFIASWCLVSGAEYIYTWSSNPLNTTLDALHRGLARQPGRCMRAGGLGQDGVQGEPTLPSLCQPAAKAVNPDVKYITALLCALSAASICWAAAITALTLRDDRIPDLTFPFIASSQAVSA